jgi:DegV family protein with EDD domain
MTRIAIVTDSTASFSEQHIGDVPVYAVPLDVIWAGETYKDGVDMHHDTFYTRLKTAKEMPTTSQPSPNAFLEVYKPLLEDGYQILSMHISEGISGTINSALQAKRILGEDTPIEIIDSFVTAMVLKMQILEAAQVINQGGSFEDAIAAVKSARERCGVFFTVETLEFLERGGRLSRMEAFAGNLLQIRPILTFVDGKIASIQKARTFKGALSALKEHFLKGIAGKQVRNISATYADNQAFVEEFMTELLQEAGIERPAQMFIDPLTPVVGTHTGPGCIGIAYLLEE